MKQDRLLFQCSKPNWLLGISFHGPYTNDNRSIKNLLISIIVKIDSYIMAKREKLCKVKYPAVILPVFFDKPLLLEPFLTYEISIDFVFNQPNPSQFEKEYVIQYKKTAIVNDKITGNFTFYQTLCPKENCMYPFAYLESGQIRHLYIWPCEFNKT